MDLNHLELKWHITVERTFLLFPSNNHQNKQQRRSQYSFKKTLDKSLNKLTIYNQRVKLFKTFQLLNHSLKIARLNQFGYCIEPARIIFQSRSFMIFVTMFLIH